MKTYPILFLTAAAALLPAIAATAAPPSAEPATVAVEFIAPEDFTDFKTSTFGGEKEQAALQKELAVAFKREAARYLPAGHRLIVRIHDIDLAGDIDAVRGPQLDDVRIVRGIYVPRMKLEYSLTAADGRVVSSGERALTDPAFDLRLKLPNSDYTFHEQEMIGDFMRQLGRTTATRG
jgi:hypothetical protein